MSIADKTRRDLLFDLVEEIHFFETPDEEYREPISLLPYRKPSVASGRYDHAEWVIPFESCETVLYLFRTHKDGRPAIITALHDTRDLKGKSAGHFDMADHNATQVVFYAALQYQLRETQRRVTFARKLVAYMEDLKVNRADVYKSIRAMNKKGSA